VFAGVFESGEGEDDEAERGKNLQDYVGGWVDEAVRSEEEEVEVEFGVVLWVF